jgi:glutamyl-tRNA synthetase
MTIRTRFAPSPTGRLHLGNVRAAVFNWLLARRHGGAFIVRIEDTDVERNVEGGEETILEDLRWLGLDWDEGPEVEGPHAPYRQSQRGHVYDAAAQRLLDRGRAYPCFCGEAALESAVGKDGREVRHYFGRCRGLTPAQRAEWEREGAEPVIRFAVPQDVGTVEIQDEVFGAISFPTADMDDFVILRSDGRATYNFAVVADDADMDITHVVRGVGHLSNTPKQALLFDALGVPRPRFAHLPTVLGADGRKLSKREGAAAVAELRAAGYPPDAVVNYLSLLGWSHPEGREVLGRQELVGVVSLERVGRADTQIDPEKLRWISAQHLAVEELDALARHTAPFRDDARFPHAAGRWPQVVDALRSRLHSYGEVDEHLPLLFGGLEERAEARLALAAYPDAAAVLEAVASALENHEPWEELSLGSVVRAAGAQAGAKGGGLFHPVRLALIGSEKGPDLGKLLAALGPHEALRRLRRAAAV